MKKVYYLGHCCSGVSAHYELIELVKEEGKRLLFHIKDFDWDTNKERIITLRAKRVTKKDFYGNDYEMIDFHSSKRQYQFHFIKEMEIDEDNYCLINYDDSMSGYIPFEMECVDEEFISAFMKNPYDDNYINFDKSDELLGDYISDYNLCDVKDVDVVIIPKEKIQKYLDLFEA